MEQKQWTILAPDGTELLLSFWDGMDGEPEVAPRIDSTRWGLSLPVQPVTA